MFENALDITFSSTQQRDAYYSQARNQMFSGGFNNGKSFGYCLKAFTLLTSYENYRHVIARNVRMDLMKTTFLTFFKICPQSLVLAQNLQEGFTILRNHSRIDWLHLKDVEESTLRGFEPNSIFADQAEEIEEKVWDILDARLGRWDQAVVPKYLLDLYPEWPKHKLTGRYIVPSYFYGACNPDTQFHHIYRNYHPDSPDKRPGYFFVEGEWDPTLGSKESYDSAMRKGEEFVDKYIRGKWGISKAQIHRVWADSLIEATPELLEHIHRKGVLFRILDHGDTSPTCCLWFAAVDGVFICYREYYAPNRLISEHREAIAELSGNESYSGNYADPAIFRVEGQKHGGFWTVADEYLTKDLLSKPIGWVAADNNEFATRNRINERLKPGNHYKNPLTGEPNAPGIYFLKRTIDYPYGCYHAPRELQSQRRELLDYINGEAVYSDNRLESIADHAYDCIRYFIAMHGRSRVESVERAPAGTLNYYRKLKKALKHRRSRANV